MPLPIDISPVPVTYSTASSERPPEAAARSHAATGREINDRRASLENAEALRRARAL